MHRRWLADEGLRRLTQSSGNADSSIALLVTNMVIFESGACAPRKCLELLTAEKSREQRRVSRIDRLTRWAAASYLPELGMFSNHEEDNQFRIP